MIFEDWNREEVSGEKGDTPPLTSTQVHTINPNLSSFLTLHLL